MGASAYLIRTHNRRGETVEQHVKILAVLNIIAGAIGICGALIVLIVFGGLAGLVSIDTSPDSKLEDLVIFGILGGIFYLVMVAIATASLIAGIALLQFRPWARMLAMIVSGLHLLNLPFGTALGIYGLWVLLKDDTTSLITRNPSLHPSR
jgi:hypothetical protein